MKITQSVLLVALSLYLVSCKTQQKLPNYLQTIHDTTGKGTVKVPELRIGKNDLLSIQVYSASTEPAADIPYNLPASGGGASGPGSSTSGGYLVDAKGNIEYPRLGTFYVDGLTKDELAAQIKKRLTEPEKLLENPTVIIRFLNLKITVIGEVNTQGSFSIPGERVTVLEAIGLAGGINDYGLKNTVKVIRETDGQLEIGKIDLSSDSLFVSTYYNLKQNDVIVIDPIPRKAKKADQDVIIQRVSFGLSIITAVALLYNIFQ
ncbi:MAG: polysaccharide biosynthesis/export family protein [Chitinophagaceae bacterium]